MTEHRGLKIALGVALVCGFLAGWSYWQYAQTWLRKPAGMSRCVMSANRQLRKPAVASGIEPHQTPDGETVYLSPAEDAAVRCVQGLSSETARRFAGAFSEQEPELRALELLKILRDVPADPASDRLAHTVYRLASGAVDALPQLPETKAVADELEETYACRFGTKLPCPRRPPIPWLVWAAGVPAALALLFAAVVGLPRAYRSIRSALAARAQRKKDAATTRATAAARVASRAPDAPVHEGAAQTSASQPPRRRKKSKRPAAPDTSSGPGESA